MSYPPYYSPQPPSPVSDPRLANKQTPVLIYQIDTGVFKIWLSAPPWAEAGSTTRFTFTAIHVKDGLIGGSATPYASGPTAAILDGSGNTVTTGITLGTVTADPTQSGNYYIDVTFASTVANGDYEIQWTATYTPILGPPALTLYARRAIRLQKTTAPSKFFFKDTSKF